MDSGHVSPLRVALPNGQFIELKFPPGASIANNLALMELPVSSAVLKSEADIAANVFSVPLLCPVPAVGVGQDMFPGSAQIAAILPEVPLQASVPVKTNSRPQSRGSSNSSTNCIAETTREVRELYSPFNPVAL